MKFVFVFLGLFSFHYSKAQIKERPKIDYLSNNNRLEQLSNFKERLKNVEIVALGENAHGLAEVFRTKTEMVKFLHEDLGFNLVLFESGFGDAALAWEKIDSLTANAFTKKFSSNAYDQSEEIKELIQYVKSRNRRLIIQGFDCQPQQDYLAQRMAEILYPIDSLLSKKVKSALQNFNKLYQWENNRDTVRFDEERDAFIGFITHCNKVLQNKRQKLIEIGISTNELQALEKSIEIFIKTYANMECGDMMNWPASANIRDKAMFEVVQWFREKYPREKMVIWAQNSHIENAPKPNQQVKFMGHWLKKTYGDTYYSIGTIVYKGRRMDNKKPVSFVHSHAKYLAYHLQGFHSDRLIMDLRHRKPIGFLAKKLLDTESFGAEAEFVAKDRFDGLLFIRNSDVFKPLPK